MITLTKTEFFDIISVSWLTISRLTVRLLTNNVRKGKVVVLNKEFAPAGPPEGVERRVGGEVRMISNLIKRRIHSKQNSEEEAVTGTGGWILGYLAANEGRDVFQRDLEEQFCMRRATVSKMIQLMEQKGLIERQSVAYDARLKKLTLTEKGRTMHLEIIAELEQTEREIRKGIPEEKLEVFFEVCLQIRNNLYGTEDNSV